MTDEYHGAWVFVILTYLDMEMYYILVCHSQKHYREHLRGKVLNMCAHVTDFRLHNLRHILAKSPKASILHQL